MIFKICAPFTDCISEGKNTRAGNAKELDVTIPMYNLLEYSYNYSKHQEVYSIITEITNFE